MRKTELAVRQAENGVLDAAPARLELQGLSARLAAQQQHLASTRHGQELQGNLPATRSLYKGLDSTILVYFNTSGNRPPCTQLAGCADCPTVTW